MTHSTLPDKVLNGNKAATQQHAPAVVIDPFESVNKFEFLRNCFVGDGGFSNGVYIIQKPLTVDDVYKRLQIDSFYSNHIEKIIKDQVFPIFKCPATSEWDTNAENVELFEDFLENVNRKGVTIHDYMSQAGTDTKLQTFTGILVDGPTEEELDANPTLSGQLENRIYPTASTINPDRFITDWTLLDKNDALIRTAYWLTIAGKKFVREWTLNAMRLYTDEEWKKGVDDDAGMDEFGNTTRKGTAQEDEFNPVGEVPIVRYYGTKVPFLTFVPFPVNWSLAKLQYRLYNCDSDIANMTWAQAHSTLIIPSNGVNIAGTGPNVALQYLKESGEPKYISPDGDQLKTLMEYRETLVKDMGRQGRITNMHQGESSATSGESKKKDFEVTAQHLKDFANETERVQDEIVRLFGLWVGSDFKYKATYPQVFFDTDSAEILENVDLYIQLVSGFSDTAVKEALKVASRAIFPKDAEFQEDINDELDAAKVDRIQNPPEPGEGDTNAEEGED